MPLLRYLLLMLCLAAVPAQALDMDELLPVDEAFVLNARAPDSDRIEISWKIADGYYLYRHRTSVQASAGFAGGSLQLPAGKAYTDEFFGDVETYRGQLIATLPGSAVAGAGSATVQVKYQGCADAGICYPPQTRNLTVALPANTAAGGFVPLGRLSLPGSGGAGPVAAAGAGMDALPLPQEQAFGLEAIALDGDQLLLRFTPARGYYLYRDRTAMTLHDADGIALQAPRWPRGTPHRDEHFGVVTV
jgi:thiol:disulfide interchange protein